MSGISRNPDEAQENPFDSRIPFHSIRATAVLSGRSPDEAQRNPGNYFALPGAHLISSGLRFLAVL